MPHVIEIKLDDFTGGHSGVEIIKGRVNANCAMARVLLNVFQNVGMRLVSVNGGEKDNAISKLSEAAIVVLPDSVDKAKKNYQKILLRNLRKSTGLQILMLT